MGRKYKNSPIIEAVCEFRFQPGAAWEKSFPDRIHEELHETFPIKRPITAFQSSLTIDSRGSQQHLQQTNTLQALREDETASVMIDVDRIAVIHAKPYPAWEVFQPLIKQGLAAYRNVATPKGLHRVGLRYINQIEMPGEQVDLSEYLNFFPVLNWRLTTAYGPFAMMMQIPFDDDRDILNLRLSSGAVNSPDAMAVILDFDYFSGQSGAMNFEQVFDWLEEAHSRVESAFEGCIKDSLREIFEEVT